METHENIKLLREKQGLSQEALALLVGYTDRSSIAKIEAGKVDLTQSKIAAFAAALHVTPAQLMGISETPPADPAPPRLDPNDIMFALSRGGEDEITDEMFDEVLNFAQYIASREQRKKNKNNPATRRG